MEKIVEQKRTSVASATHLADGSPRLPMSHPEYRYPGSRNPYSAKVQTLRGRIFSDNGTEQFRGRWLAQFPDTDKTPAAPSSTRRPLLGGAQQFSGGACDQTWPKPGVAESAQNVGGSVLAPVPAAPAGARRPLKVEIGCNAGHVTVEWAARDPKTAFIGLDWKFKPIFRAAEKALKRDIHNLIFLRAHADRIEYIFEENEIDFLALYFPDPWPKKSQLKNRWLTADRLKSVAKLVRPGGIFHIKTDHLGYFEWMEDAISQVGELWETIAHTRDLHAGHPAPEKLKSPDVTLFESLFIKDGIKINSVTLRRR
jgi:tRNA (guanine-N7-)-methyltransferase